jgi:integrase
MGSRAGKARDGLYRRGRIWWVRTDPITGQALSTKCTDLEAARRWRAQRERTAADPAHAAATTAQLGTWIRELVRVKREQGRAAATLEVCEQKLGHAARIFGVTASLSTITPDALDAYVAQRRGEGASNHTISKEFDMLAAMLRLAKRAGCYPGDVDALRPPDLVPGYRPRTRALTWVELPALLAQLVPRRAAFVQAVVALGTRRSEVFRLPATAGEVTAVLIPGTKTAGAYRMVPVLSVYRELWEAAAPYLPLEPWPNLSRDLAAACERAGIAPVTPNDLRRTHATLLVERGVDRDVVRRLLGHTTTAMVDRVYGQPRVTALAALAEQALDSTLHLRDTPEPNAEKLSRLGDLNPRPTVYETELATPEPAATVQKTADSYADSREANPGTGADATSTRHPAHSPAAWALALAASRVGVTGRMLLLPGEIRKRVPRAG